MVIAVSPATSWSIILIAVSFVAFIGWCCCRASALAEQDRFAQRMDALGRATRKEQR